jgi:hypothetical protein
MGVGEGRKISIRRRQFLDRFPFSHAQRAPGERGLGAIPLR